MSGIAMSSAAQPPGTVTLSGQTIAGGWSATAGFQFDSDGNVYQVVDGVPTQIDTGTDWIRPTSVAKADYEIKYTVNSGAVSSGFADWSDLATDRLVDTATAMNLTVEIRRRGGAVVASGTYVVS